jgi:hypothetical protein
MASKRLFWTSLALFLVLGALLTPYSASASSSAGIAVDAVPGGAIDASRAVADTAPFTVDIVITEASTPYQGYQAYLSWDDSLLAYVDPPGVTYTGLGGLSLNATPEIKDNDSDTMVEGVQLGSANATTAISATGTVAAVSLQCIADGTSSLHLVTVAEDAAFGTAAIASGGGKIETTLADAQITCGEGGPVPTATPGGPVPTATPGGPVPTPGGPAATPTPLPPGYEAVNLAAGCNPVTSTYPNATPIGTIAAAVGPAGNLNALWQFEGSVWLGYSPAYPQASDLTASDLLDVVFMCVMGPGQFGRPIV